MEAASSRKIDDYAPKKQWHTTFLANRINTSTSNLIFLNEIDLIIFTANKDSMIWVELQSTGYNHRCTTISIIFMSSSFYLTIFQRKTKLRLTIGNKNNVWSKLMEITKNPITFFRNLKFRNENDNNIKRQKLVTDGCRYLSQD